MILGAGLLVLVGLVLFVAGVTTGATFWFWLCVLACLAAGVLLILARRKIAAVPTGGSTGGPAATATGTSPGPPTEGPAVEGPAVEGPAVERPAVEGPAVEGPAVEGPAVEGPAAVPTGDVAGAAARRGRHAPPSAGAHADAAVRGEPPVEEVEVTDLLLVVDLHDEVLVVDEHPRYHLPGCRWLAGKETIALPIDEARTDGFSPCGRCAPDQHLADVERGRRRRP